MKTKTENRRVAGVLLKALQAPHRWSHIATISGLCIAVIVYGLCMYGPTIYRLCKLLMYDLDVLTLY